MENTCRNRILTVPNLLSLLRLAMIPWMVWLYAGKGNGIATAAVLVLSGLTDIADGIIARKFHMVTDFGKAFDPVADKLTQLAILLCLVGQFPGMLLSLVLLVVKELFSGITGLLVIRKTGQVLGASWHGKAATAALYATMALHLLWPRIPEALSGGAIGCCCLLIGLSGILYGVRNLGILSKGESFENS